VSLPRRLRYSYKSVGLIRGGVDERKSMMRTLRVLLVCMLVAAGTAFAQDWKGKATLSGTVTDPAGKGIGGATVTLTFTSLKAGTQAKTNGQGEWLVKNVANGVWDVKIVKEGFEPKEFEVEVGGQMKNPHVDVRLGPTGSASANASLAEADQNVPGPAGEVPSGRADPHDDRIDV
jgi:hypothetical protein